MKQYFLCIIFLLIFFGSNAQQTSKVDFKNLQAEISILPSEKKVTGNISYTFDVLKETDSIFIDAQEMKIEAVKLNNEEVDFFNNREQLWILSDFEKSSGNKLTFNYSATPKQAIYFVGWDSFSEEKNQNDVQQKYPPQVWTQGQGKYTSHWLPSFDDPTQKLEFDLSINFKKGYEFIANGKLMETSVINDSIIKWEFDMEKPMSSYLVAIAAGKYKVKETETFSGIPLLLYYYRGEENLVGPTYRHTKEIFGFLENEIGFPYPWQNYKQIPVRDFLYSGMENTGTTIFSDAFLIDSVAFKDRNYVMVNAHELAHQWFGDLVTAASGKHHWLQESFATFYALLAEREIFGDDYYYWQLFETAEKLKERSDLGEGESLLNPNANSLTFYQKGALALHVLREKVGVQAFNTAVENYLRKHKYGIVTTEDFMNEVEKNSGKNLSLYVENWLEQSAFQATAALNSLKKSEFITNYLQVAALKELPLQNKKEHLNQALNFPVNDYIGQEVVHQLAMENPTEVLGLYKKAFATNNIFVRQAIAASLNPIPEELKREFESLLSDESYLTKELALYNLWMNFPQDRSRYLDKTRGIKGFPDKNVRILWLALNLATPEYHPNNKTDIYTELSGYTSKNYPFQIRQNAFRYLFQLNAFNDESLKNLMQASTHEIYKFRSFSRDMVKQLLENEEYQLRLKRIQENLPIKQQEYLKQVLGK